MAEPNMAPVMRPAPAALPAGLESSICAKPLAASARVGAAAAVLTRAGWGAASGAPADGGAA